MSETIAVAPSVNGFSQVVCLKLRPWNVIFSTFCDVERPRNASKVSNFGINTEAVDRS